MVSYLHPGQLPDNPVDHSYCPKGQELSINWFLSPNSVRLSICSVTFDISLRISRQDAARSAILGSPESV